VDAVEEFRGKEKQRIKETRFLYNLVSFHPERYKRNDNVNDMLTLSWGNKKH